jgi:hypothetical protein
LIAVFKRIANLDPESLFHVFSFYNGENILDQICHFLSSNKKRRCQTLVTLSFIIGAGSNPLDQNVCEVHAKNVFAQQIGKFLYFDSAK